MNRRAATSRAASSPAAGDTRFEAKWVVNGSRAVAPARPAARSNVALPGILPALDRAQELARVQGIRRRGYGHVRYIGQSPEQAEHDRAAHRRRAAAARVCRLRLSYYHLSISYAHPYSQAWSPAARRILGLVPTRRLVSRGTCLTSCSPRMLDLVMVSASLGYRPPDARATLFRWRVWDQRGRLCAASPSRHRVRYCRPTGAAALASRAD